MLTRPFGKVIHNSCVISIKFIKLTRQETYSLKRLVNGSSSPGCMVEIILLDMSLENKKIHLTYSLRTQTYFRLSLVPPKITSAKSSQKLISVTSKLLFCC